MILSKLPEMENDEIYQSDESPSPTFIEESNTVDESIAVEAESEYENLAVNENFQIQTAIENIVEDDAIVISEEDNINETSNNHDNEASSGIVFKLFQIRNK